jgi:hypothetical protein
MSMSPLSKIAYAVTTAAVLATATEPTSHADAAAMQYLGQWQLPHEAFIGGTRIGGLSGISYDAQRGVYYAISDDKSTFGKVRLYTVRLALSSKGIDDAQFVGTQPLLDESGNPFRAEDDAANPPVVAPDAEGIAFDDARQQIYWTSEGFAKKSANGGERVLANPWIRVAGLDGTYRGEFTLPPGFTYSPDGSSGPRPNNALEGLSLSPDGRFLFAAMEAPLLQDGPAVNADHGALIRITKFDIESRTPVAQYAYRVEASPPPTRFNGVSDILALSDTSFLVVERAATLPDLAVSIYRADVDSATDTLHMPSLSAQPVTPMTKTLATDLNAVPGLKPLDNIEGITLGPKMPDGHQSVLLVSDDNFSPSEVTQFLAFAI